MPLTIRRVADELSPSALRDLHEPHLHLDLPNSVLALLRIDLSLERLQDK